MSKTISLRIDDSVYKALKAHAEAENRSISNFLETAALRYLEESDYVDDFEMESIRNDSELLRDLKQGLEDAQNARGRFV
jgi:predicted transcriptional regulator